MPFTSSTSAMPFSSDTNHPLMIALAEAWALVCLCSARIAQDALQIFAQANRFQVDRLVPAFGRTGQHTDPPVLSTEKLKQLDQQLLYQFAQANFIKVLAIALPLQPSPQWGTREQWGGDSYELLSQCMYREHALEATDDGAARST